MRTRTLALCLGMLSTALLAQNNQPNGKTAPDGTAEPQRQPYLIRLRALDEEAATKLAAALGELPGVNRDGIEAFPGEERKIHMVTTEGRYVSEEQIASAVKTQGLELEAFEIPQWARLRLYVVEASGGGWGAAKLAREAMQDLEGVDTLRMNGARATFTLKEGVSFDETKVAAVFAERKMQLETFAKVNPPRPQTMRVYAVKSGLGWASIATRVRATLNRHPGVQDTFVDQNDITLLLEPGAKPDLEAISALLEKENIVVEKATTREEQGF